MLLFTIGLSPNSVPTWVSWLLVGRGLLASLCIRADLHQPSLTVCMAKLALLGCVLHLYLDGVIAALEISPKTRCQKRITEIYIQRTVTEILPCQCICLLGMAAPKSCSLFPGPCGLCLLYTSTNLSFAR